MRGQSFQSPDVANCYKARPEYPATLYAALIDLVPPYSRALDLGCGTGKIARALCRSFHAVTAVDASRSMLDVAQTMPNGDNPNITWLHGLAEDVELDYLYELVVAGASIHWMDHEILFPRLASYMAQDSVFAVVDGDGAHSPPWSTDWELFLGKWIYTITGERYEPQRTDTLYSTRMARHREWMVIEGVETFEHTVSQTLDAFVLCQHSRDTFAVDRLQERTELFDGELMELLQPHADQGVLTYTVKTTMEWGQVRKSRN